MRRKLNFIKIKSRKCTHTVIPTFRKPGDEGPHSDCRWGLGACHLFTVMTTSRNCSPANGVCSCFSVHWARTGYQHHKWKENEQVEPLSLQRGPNHTTHSVYCQNRAFCCWALWVKHRANVGCSKPCPFKSKLLVSVKFDQSKHSFRKKVNGVTLTSKDLMRYQLVHVNELCLPTSSFMGLPRHPTLTKSRRSWVISLELLSLQHTILESFFFFFPEWFLLK